VPGLATTSRSSYVAFVGGTFFYGWLLGFALVFRLWHLAHAPRWMMLSPMGYVSFMMAPALVGVLFTRTMGQLASRGWRGMPLGLIGLGAGGLVLGLLAV
jgi:hypothetical protein